MAYNPNTFAIRYLFGAETRVWARLYQYFTFIFVLEAMSMDLGKVLIRRTFQPFLPFYRVVVGVL
jgi:hypothetical protein